MRREAAALGALALAGCISTSVREDVARIEALAAVELDESVLDAVRATPDPEVAPLLREPLTPEAALRIAMAQNRELRASLRELGIDRGRALQASLLPNPVFELDLRHQEDRAQPLQVELYLEWDLTDALLAPVRAEAARSELDAARYRAAAAVVRTAFEVRAALYGVQAAEQELALALRALDAMAAGRDAASALFEAGTIPELDYAAQLAAYEEERAAVAELELERLDRRERLHRLLGLHGEATGWTVAAELAPVGDLDAPAPDVERAAIEASLELAGARDRLRALAQRIALTHTEGWLPDVAIDGHMEQDGQTWELGGGASVSLPIFDRREGDAAAYEAEFDATMERLHGAAVDVRSAARMASNRVASAHARARAWQDAIAPARRRVYEQTVLQYNAMQVGAIAIIDARRAQLDAERRAVRARLDYWVARAALEALLRGARVELRSDAPSEPTSTAGAAGGGH